jgi:hypothetical protein
LDIPVAGPYKPVSFIIGSPYEYHVYNNFSSPTTATKRMAGNP